MKLRNLPRCFFQKDRGGNFGRLLPLYNPRYPPLTNNTLLPDILHPLPPQAVFLNVSSISGCSFQMPKSSEASIEGSPGVTKIARPLGSTVRFNAGRGLFSIVFDGMGRCEERITFTAFNNCSSVVTSISS